MFSPYSFLVNNPLSVIDPDGRDTLRVGKDGIPVAPQLPAVEVTAQANSSANASGYSYFALYNGMVRTSYAYQAHRLKSQYGGNPSNGGPNLEGNLARLKLKQKYRRYAVPGTEKVLDLVELLEMKQTRVRYWRTRTSVNAMGGAGIVLGAYGVYNSVDSIVNADDPVTQTAYEAGGWGGAWAGMAIAAPYAAQTGNAFSALAITATGGAVGAYAGEAAVRQLVEPGPPALTPRFHAEGGVVYPSDHLRSAPQPVIINGVIVK